MLRALLLEDSPRDVEIIRELLIDAGFDLDMDCTAMEKEFISLLRSRTYDIILADFKLPGFDGFAALRWSREISPQVPFICVSGTIGEDTAVDLLKQGAVDYVLKDRLAKLPSAIHRALGEVKEKEAHRQAEAALRESEEKYRVLAESSPEMIYLMGRDGHVLYMNNAAASQFHAKPFDLIGKHLTELFPPHLAHQNLEGIQKVIDSNKGSVRELVQQFPSGEKWIDTRLSPIIDASGEVLAVLGLSSDITERKQAEEALNYERNLFKALTDNIPDHIYFKDKESRFLRISRSMVNIFGLDDPAQAVGKTDFDFFAEGHARPAFEDEQKIMESGIAIIGFEEKELWPDGRETWVSTTKAPLKDAQGEIIGTIGISRDITKRKQAEEERQRLITAVEHTAEAILVTDPRGIIQYVNPAFEHITGFTRKEAIGQNPRILNSGQQSAGFYEELWRTISTGGKWKGRFINKKKHGIFFTDDTSISPVINEKGEIINYVGVKRDITSELSLQTQLTQAQKLESIGTLASGISHDFNNILGIIMGHTTLLERLREDSDKHSESVTAIMKATQRGAALVKQLMLFARKTEALAESVNVNNIIREITKLLKETFPKTITISISLQRDLPVIVADSSQIHQVLLNLLVNARDAMPTSGMISITTGVVECDVVRSQFPKAPARQYVRLEVADTGTGMDESTRQKIFEPFFTTKGVGKGTGLGLSVVYGIVEHHGGFIDVQSVLGKGTHFDVYLPIPERAVEGTHAGAKELAEIPGGTETILIIEDEEILRELMKASFLSKGYTVLTAEDGLQGVEMYQSHQKEIAVVLTDMGLPILSGQDVFRKIREINPKAKVILASGFIEPEAKSQMYSVGLKTFIQKPYMQDEVLRKIRETIDAR